MKAQDFINNVIIEDRTLKNSINPYKDKNNRLRNFVWTVFGMLLLVGVVFGATVITDDNVNSPTSTFTNVTADRINEILYVQAGNGSDINATINKCHTDGCTVIIPSGNYPLDNTVYLRSNLTLEIKQGASIYWNIGATPQIITDQQGTTYNQMIYANNSNNIGIFNYGILEATKIVDLADAEQFVHIDNGKNIRIYGGHLEGGINDAGSGIVIYNSNNTEVYGIYSNKLSEAVWEECTQRANIHDIICIAGGDEGECIEMNGYSQYVSISNIITEGGNFASDQSIDLNANRYVTLNNIISNNAYKVIRDTTLSGIRFGTCPEINGSNIIGTNIQCNNCNVSSSPSTENSSWNILENNKSIIFYGDYKFNDSLTVIDFIDSNSLYDIRNQGEILSMNFNNGSISGNKILDSSSENNHGTNNGAIHNRTGGFNDGGNYVFDGVNDRIDTFTDNSVFQNGFTISAWINPLSLGEGNLGRIVDKSSGSTGGDGFLFRLNTNNVIQFRINGGTTRASKSNSINLDEWQHVVVTVSEGQLANFYVNGILSGNPNQDLIQGVSTIITTNALAIGNRAIQTDKSFNGSIDNLKIYSNVLSSNEIKALYYQRIETENSYVSQKDIQVDTSGNLTLRGKITFAFGETIDNIVDGWIRITGDLNVTEGINVGSSGNSKNVTMYSPDGTEFTCGVNNAGSFTCT